MKEYEIPNAKVKTKVPGNMINAGDKMIYCKDHHLSMGGNDWLVVQDMGEDVWLTLKNECTPDNPKYKEYYHAEISKKSKLWQTLVSVVKDCHKFKGE